MQVTRDTVSRVNYMSESGIVTTNLNADSFDSKKITSGIINESDLKTSRTVKTNFRGDFA